MDEKFTPGPWRRWSLPFVDSIEVRTECLETTVAILDGSCFNANANSRLISAAPDMYSVLSSLEWVESCEYFAPYCPRCGHYKPKHADYCEIQAALKKVRGEQ